METGRRRLIFLRPHKTGSTSFHEAIRQAYPPEQVCPWVFPHEFSRVSAEALRRYSYFWPHLGIDQARRIDEGAIRVAAVREPKSRLLSSFYFWKEQGNATRTLRTRLRTLLARGRWPHETAYLLKRMTLLEFLESDHPAVIRSSDDYLLRFFAGADFGRSSVHRTQLFLPEGMTKDEMLERALANVEQLDLTLILERFAESVRRLNDATGLGVPEAEIRTNVNQTRPRTVLSDEEREALENRTAYDQRVYGDILARFDGAG